MAIGREIVSFPTASEPCVRISPLKFAILTPLARGNMFSSPSAPTFISVGSWLDRMAPNSARSGIWSDNSANKTVGEVVKDVIQLRGGGEVIVKRDPNAPHEDHWLQLNCDRAYEYLRWKPTWNYSESVPESVRWYRQYQDGSDVYELTSAQIEKYSQDWVKAGND